MKNLCIIAKLSSKNLLYKLDLIALSKKNKRLEKKVDELSKNNDYLFNENTTLKQINRKRYVLQEDKMAFLIKREKKLQEIEQMAKNKVKWSLIKNRIIGDK